MKQKLVWLPSVEKEQITPRVKIEHDDIRRVWVLIGRVDEHDIPNLPIQPIHGQNAFLESRVHDYYIKDGKLIYSGIMREGGVWLLLECGE